MTDKTELDYLAEIARWTRLAALPGIRARSLELLETDSKRRAYAAMDGATGVIAIEKATGANHNDIAKWLKAWVSDGLVDPDTVPPKASFTLPEHGIDTPPPKSVRSKKATS
jgi:hypothetical protein